MHVLRRKVKSDIVRRPPNLKKYLTGFDVSLTPKPVGDFFFKNFGIFIKPEL